MGRERILVVDGDFEDAERLRSILEDGGYEACVPRGEAGEPRMPGIGEDYQVVICSIDPVRFSLDRVHADGLDRIAQLQRDAAGAAVIATTRRGEVSVVRKAFGMGASDVLLKPLHDREVWTTVARVLERSNAQRKVKVYQQHLEALVTRRADQLRELRRDLELSCELTIEALGETLDLRDEETEGHSKRVTAYTSMLARAVGLHASELKMTVRGAFLHDIGKIAVPDSILLKPASLTEDEMAIMRRHCEHGYAIVRKIPRLAEAAEIVYAHQEKFDGTGYPRGLRGDEIPLGARIFAIADALDAITSDRPYRKASSFAYAIGEIERSCGKQFDPAIVEAFLSLPREEWKMLRDQVSRESRPAELWQARVEHAEPPKEALHLIC